MSIGIHGCHWMSMDIHGHFWICINIMSPWASATMDWDCLQHDNDSCFHYDKMQVLLPAATAMISAMQQQTFYEYITAADYCKLLIISKAISKAFAPLGGIVMLSKCHGMKNAEKGKLKQQCTRAPCHLIAESGVHVCGNHAIKNDKSTVWYVALGHLANIQPRVVDMNPQVGNAEAHSMIPTPPHPTPSHPIPPSHPHPIFEKLENNHLLCCDSQTYIVSPGIPKHTLFPQGSPNVHCLPRDSHTYIVSPRIPKHTLLPQGFPNIQCSPRDSQTYIVSQGFPNIHCFPRDFPTYIASPGIPKHTLFP